MNYPPNMNKINFPNNLTINNFIIEYKLNDLLNNIMTSILYNTTIKKRDSTMVTTVLAIPNNIYNNISVAENSIKIKNSMFHHYSPELIKEVKIILCEKGYIITDIEDDGDTNIGWKLSW